MDKTDDIQPVDGKYHIPPRSGDQKEIILQFDNPQPDPSKVKVKQPAMPNDLPKVVGNHPEPITWFNIFKVTDKDNNPIEDKNTPPYTIISNSKFGIQ